MLKYLSLIGLVASLNCMASDSDFENYLSLTTGMVNLSYTEVASQIKQTNDTLKKEPGSGSASVLSLSASYHMPMDIKKEIYFSGIVPFSTASGSALMSGNVGGNYFFNGISSSIKSVNSEVVFKVKPKFRYYAGGDAGLAYLIYVTKTAKKTDFIIDLSAHVGGIYSWKDRWNIKAEAGFGKGMGTKVSSTGMKLFAGVTYSL